MAPKGGNNFRNTDMGTNQDLFNIKVFFAAAGILGVAFLGLTWLSRGELGFGEDANPAISQNVQADEILEEASPQTQLSRGDKVLLTTSATPLKEAGVNAIAANDYDTAITSFANARNVDKSDPEALIYLNNARIGDNDAHSLAVIAPLEAEPTAAANILRGVAQAQTEINQAGGIQAKPLRVLLADDKGEPEVAQQIATELSQLPEVVGVIGHHSPSTANAAAEIYTRETLPFVSTSSQAASGSIQPLVASDLPIAEALAFYMEKLNHKTAILFYDGDSDYSLSFKTSFEKALQTINGTMTAEINLTDLPNSAPTETPEAEIFVLSPGDSPLKTATDSIEIIPNDKVDHFYRHVFGGYELFSPDVLNLFGSMATGTILAVPDAIYQSAASPFSQETKTVWETTVDWTTSASYNTVQSVITGLEQSPTRQGVQQALDSTTNDAVRILRVSINPENAAGYDLISLGVMTADGFKPD